MARIRVLIVDDHPIMCAGIQSLLSNCEDVQVVGQANDGVEALVRIETLRPHVVIMDIAMPKMNGIEATRRIRKNHPDVRVLILTQHDERQYVLPLLKAGASGIVPKRALVVDLRNALRTVARGEVFLHPTVAALVVGEVNRRDVMDSTATVTVTPREHQVLERIADGETTAQIAAALGLGVKTIESHRRSLMTKLGVHNMAELVRVAVQDGLVSKSH